jgi:hypothetical protein
MRAPWLEPHDEFEGVGAHELNSRYTPVDEVLTGVPRRRIRFVSASH